MSVNTILSIVFGVLIAFFVIAVLTGMNIPFASGGKDSIITLAVIGIVACGAAGVGNNITRFEITNPFNIIGSILGILALLIVILALVGVNIPLIADSRAAFTVLGGILILMVVLKIVQNSLP